MKIFWTIPALRDLEQEADYLAQKAPLAVSRMVEKINQTVQLLLQHPEMGRTGRITKTRELVVVDTPFVIPYRIKEKRIEILRVFHGARRWPKKL